jgi:hypothetical protein
MVVANIVVLAGMQPGKKYTDRQNCNGMAGLIMAAQAADQRDKNMAG